jgi:cell division protein ZapA
MAQVTVTIDGKAYRMACEEGQEDHLMQLAGRFDRYVGHLKGQFGEIGDLRLTVMASIMIMDELTETERRIRDLGEEVDQLRRARDGVMAESESATDGLAMALADVTGEIERLATKLTGTPPVTHN